MKLMCFVGRQREIKKIFDALEKGRNVIISGQYGIGKTSMVKQLAKDNHQRWHFSFLDFSQTPGQMAKALMSKYVFCRQCKAHKNIHYKARRYLLSQVTAKKKSIQVIVLDNIAKVTPQRFAFLRELLLGKNYLFIAVAESFLPEKSLFDLRAHLYPSDYLNLRHLSKRDTCAYFAKAAIKYHLPWTQKQMAALAEISRGYPLNMHETVKRHLKARASKNPVQTGAGCEYWSEQ